MVPDWKLEGCGDLQHPKLCFRSYWRYPESLIEIAHDLTLLWTWRMLMDTDWRLGGRGHLGHPKSF